MRALYFAMVVLILVATAMNVEGFYKVPSCTQSGGRCDKVCGKYEVAQPGYDCSVCCFPYKRG